MDSNPFDLQRIGNRLRFISLISGLTVEVDSGCRMEVKSAERLIAQHNHALIGLQTACGLSPNARAEDRQAMYQQWHYYRHN